MTDRELNRAVAEKVLGCRVQDATFYDHCTCVGYIHGSLGQVPRLSWYTDFPSALRVAREAHRRFGLVVGAHLTGREICEAALGAAEAKAWTEMSREAAEKYRGQCPYVIPDTCEITAEMAEEASLTGSDRVRHVERQRDLAIAALDEAINQREWRRALASALSEAGVAVHDLWQLSDAGVDSEKVDALGRLRSALGRASYAAARDEMLKEAPQTYAGAGRDVSFSRPTEAESERRAQQAATAAEHADTTRKFSNLAAPESFARGGPCPYVIPDTCEITAEMAEDASPLADALDKAGTGVALLYASIVRNESRAEFLIALGDILTALRAAARAAREEGR